MRKGILLALVSFSLGVAVILVGGPARGLIYEEETLPLGFEELAGQLFEGSTSLVGQRVKDEGWRIVQTDEIASGRRDTGLVLSFVRIERSRLRLP